MKQKEVKSEHHFAAVSILLIPVLTLLFGTQKSPFRFTLSMIGNRFDARIEFIIWGIISGALFIFYILHLFKLGAFFNPEARKLVIRSGVFLALTVIIPAIEELWPVLHRLHAVCAAFFGLSLVAAVFYFIRYLKSFDKKLYSFSFILLMTVVGGSVLLLFIFGNSGIFELFFFISISIVLFIMEILLKKARSRFFNHIKNVQDFLSGKKKTPLR